MKEKIKIIAPASSANMGSGFDLIGLALDHPADIVEVSKNKNNILKIINQTNVKLPLAVDKNVASVGVKHLLDHLNIQQGFDIVFRQKINPGSGLGSSAASAVAAVFGVNHLLGSPLTKKQLVHFATLGEKVASDAYHADNVAPAMLGGVQFIRKKKPLKIINLPFPKNLRCVIIFPEVELSTKECREILPSKTKLKKAVRQCGNFGALIYGFMQKNSRLIGKAMHDELVEPYRIPYLPAYKKIRNIAMNAGALGVCISGSGPSILSITDKEDAAEQIMQNCSTFCKNMNIKHQAFISKINKEGVKIFED